LDLTTYDDTFTSDRYQHIYLPYHFIQIAPSFSYHLWNRKFQVPVELGLAINKRVNEADIFYIDIKEYNYDIRLSSGIHYQLSDLTVGGNFVFSKSLNSYQNKSSVSGSYNPYQFGFELSLGYNFKIGKTMTNIE
jgi:hypothetical protein